MAKTKDEEQSQQQQYLQLQMLQQQIEQTSQQLEGLAQQFTELEITQDALKQLQGIPKNNEVLATIAPGIFIKTALKDNQKLIINVGASTTAEKTIPQVITLLEKQKAGLELTLAESDAELQKLTQQAMELYQKLENKQ
ncbi:prefoldin subunit alpha [Candidatus Woesearchaeota archaeon]|nr:prefoldin subunit alpha [Candidatus Woesearchaeota archaeon]